MILLHGRRKLVRELSESLCRKVNARILSDEKLITETFDTHIDSCTELAPDVKSEYDIIDDFTAEVEQPAE